MDTDILSVSFFIDDNIENRYNRLREGIIWIRKNII